MILYCFGQFVTRLVYPWASFQMPISLGANQKLSERARDFFGCGNKKSSKSRPREAIANTRTLPMLHSPSCHLLRQHQTPVARVAGWLLARATKRTLGANGRSLVCAPFEAKPPIPNAPFPES